MNVQDLETAKRLAIPLVCLVWVDGGYGLIKWKQQTQFDGQHSELAFSNPDFERGLYTVVAKFPRDAASV